MLVLTDAVITTGIINHIVIIIINIISGIIVIMINIILFSYFFLLLFHFHIDIISGLSIYFLLRYSSDFFINSDGTVIINTNQLSIKHYHRVTDQTPYMPFHPPYPHPSSFITKE